MDTPSTSTVHQASPVPPAPEHVVTVARRRDGAPLVVGAGIVAAASDVDPTTVGVLVAVGATSGSRMAWACLLVFPVLGVVQLLATQVGSVTGTDLQALSVRRHGRRRAALLAVSVVVVNVFTIAADVDAGASALADLVPAPPALLVVVLVVVLGAVVVLSSVRLLHRVLGTLLLGMVAAVACVVALHPDWGAVVRSSVVPALGPGRSALDALTALFGTAVTSYVYVWQTRAVAEEGAGATGLRRARGTALAGAAVTAVLMWAVLVAASPLEGGRGAAGIGSTHAAAVLFGRVLGPAARIVFSAGVVASSLLALVVLVSTTGAVLGAELTSGRGTLRRLGDAPRVAGTVVASAALGVLLAALDVRALSAVVAASIAGALAAPVSLAFLVVLARDRTVMGDRPASLRLVVAGWAVVALAVGLAVAYLVSR